MLAGSLVGSLLAYGLCANRLVERVPVARVALDRWDGLPARHCTRAVFLARLLPLARTFVSLPTGARHIRLDTPLALVLTGVLVGAAWMTVDSAGGRVLLVVGLFTLALTLFR